MNRKRTGLVLGSLALVLAGIAGGTLWLSARHDSAPNEMAEVRMERTYHNPLTLADEWEDYGIGDPYVLRFNGKYYLYCSTKDWRVGIKAWSSEDLVNWTYEGLVTEEPLTEGAYAPEVVYWNGSFYMYTSPAGKGHYVLESDSPTGPFQVKTDNIGLSIDGSVFIDDDSRWYFTHAATGGIMGAPMSDPYTVEPGQMLNASLGHWTEGSMIIKRNGRYYMTYTGNHVFSKGYRVNYAVGHESPLGLYTIPENNPLLLSTAENFNGLGHSATVLGPDLDSYYIVYHNLIGHSAEGPPVRKLNIDRLVFNGDKMAVLGPTHDAPAEAPKLPLFADRLNGTPGEDNWQRAEAAGFETAWLSKAVTGERYTAEFNLVPSPGGTSPEGTPKAASSASAAILLSYAGVAEPADGSESRAKGMGASAGYRLVAIDEAAAQLVLSERTVSGEEQAALRVPLPPGTELSKLHTVRAEADAAGTRIYWDGLLLADCKEWAGTAGSIGYAWGANASPPQLGYTAFSAEAGGSSDWSAVKPLPGSLEAVHGLAHPLVRQAQALDGSYAAKLAEKGDRLVFPVNVQREGTYLIAAMVSRQSAGAELELAIGGHKQRVTLDAGDFPPDADWVKLPLTELPLAQGLQQLTVSLVKGTAELRYLEAATVAPVAAKAAIEMNVDMASQWQAEDGKYFASNSGQDAKLYGGDPEWTDYRLSFELIETQETMEEAAVLLRTTMESTYPDQVADAFIGYELAFRNGRVLLRKISYEVKEELDSALLDLVPGKPQPIAVRLNGPHIQVYAGDSPEPLLIYTDSNALLHGRIGFRASSPDWLFANPFVEPPSI